MANRDAPSGFNAIGSLDSADYHGKLQNVCFLAADSTACFIGDAVELTGSGSVDGRYPSVTQCAAGDRVYGYLVSLEPDFEDESSLSQSNFRRASTLRFGKVLIADGTEVSIQEDSVGGALTVDNIGQNIDVIVGAGDTITGISGMELDSSTAATTNTLVFRLLRYDEATDNEVGDFARWVVTANLTNLNNTTGV